MTTKMTKQINEQENIVKIFPMFFFVIGLMLQAFLFGITNNWFIEGLIMFIGIEIYCLFLLWFFYELSQFKLKLIKNTKK